MNLNLKYLIVSWTDLAELNIQDLSHLEYLLLTFNFDLSEVDLSQNINLIALGIDVCLDQLDVSNNIHLEQIGISDSGIQSLDLSNNSNLDNLYIGHCPYFNQIIFPTDSSLSNFRTSALYNLETVNLSNLTLLTNLLIGNTHLSSLNISNNVLLESIDLSDNEFLTATYVWQLPLPENVTLYKDNHNILYVP